MLERDGQRLVEVVATSDLEDNEDEFWDVLSDLYDHSEDADITELTQVLGTLSDLMPGLPSHLGGQVALVGGAFVERGAEPEALVKPLFDILVGQLDGCGAFLLAWQDIQAATAGADDGTGSDTDPAKPAPGSDEAFHVPNSEDPAGMQDTYGQLAAVMDSGKAYELTMVWYTLDSWIRPAITLLQHRSVREDLPHRSRLAEAANALESARGELRFLAHLLRVLDDEPLLVLHRASGKGFRMRMSGVGDNFQLHTLLATRLLSWRSTVHRLSDGDKLVDYRGDNWGDHPAPADGESWGLLEGEGPEVDQIVAATFGESPKAEMTGYFNLTDATGEWIWNEGVPADIPIYQDERVIVLDPPPYARTWTTGRTFLDMRPTLDVEEIMSDDEAAAWLARVGGPREDGVS